MEGKPRYQAQPAVTVTKDENGKVVVKEVKTEETK